MAVDHERFLDLAQLAKRLCLSRRTIRSHVADPADPLPAYRLGGKLLFRWKAVEAWLETHRVRPLNPDDIADGIVAKLSDTAAGDRREIRH